MKRILAISACLALGGCVAVAVAAAGAAAYVGYEYFEGGWAKADFQHDMDSTWNASLEACKRLGYGLPSGLGHDGAHGEFVAVSADEAIQFQITRKTDRLTRVEVKVGDFGDETASRTIMDTIGNVLSRP